MLLYADKLFSKEWFKSLYLIIQGALVAAFGYNFFLIPHKIIPGGLMGLSSVFYHLIGIPVGLLTIILNIPLILGTIMALCFWGFDGFGTVKFFKAVFIFSHILLYIH